ncbi:hypothetical protein NQ314_020076 [Rhamnusium bicolor]|uniref:Transmembrane protein 218 n=1 Tax=Rhamnusium bicolor TaxID=1586634 RepID=A0AAV8WLV1_9CUCU|nr:hypothetical protein NQ314_020076 [Rhamnusium bicolor]
MTTIGNIGIGLLLLIIVWIIALIVFVVGVKLQSNISWIALGSATVLTILLLIIPTDKKHQPIEEPEDILRDYGIIYKNLFLAFLWLTGLVGFASFFVLHCIEPVRPKPIKSFYD